MYEFFKYILLIINVLQQKNNFRLNFGILGVSTNKEKDRRIAYEE